MLVLKSVCKFAVDFRPTPASARVNFWGPLPLQRHRHNDITPENLKMAQDVKSGLKRGPGRPPKDHTPAAKKLRTFVLPPSTIATPTTQSPVPEKKAARLPARIIDSKPLPTLSEPQPLSLANEEYQSIAASAVLASSLDRSRQRWITNGIFQKYWVKPEKLGKNAKPLPPNNPDPKRMKEKGECRIRIEPHIFVADVYVEEKPKPPATQAKQYMQHQHPYGQLYRPPAGQQSFLQQPVQRTTMSPVEQSGTVQPPTNSGQRKASTQHPSQPERPFVAVSTATTQQNNQKPSPDPVISMLASRASSNPELKALMKEVATGNANQDQLRVFQRHIDELTAIIQKQKRDEEEQQSRAQQQANGIKDDVSMDTKPTQPNSQAQQQQSSRSQYNPQLPPAPPQQPVSAAPASTSLPVILEFKTTGASEDRFLFPEMSILESLSPQHELVSFIITRKGCEAADATGLEPDQEYWQPVTLMIEVAYGREEILKCIQRWVKPAEEVRKHMEGVMQRCQRAPQTYLPLRLPYKSTAVPESEDVSTEATPVAEERTKSKSSVKYVKKANATTMKKRESVAQEALQSNTAAPEANSATAAGSGLSAVPDESGSKKDAAAPDAIPSADAEATGTGRPRRAVRKSVRISEG